MSWLVKGDLGMPGVSAECRGVDRDAYLLKRCFRKGLGQARGELMGTLYIHRVDLGTELFPIDHRGW